MSFKETVTSPGFLKFAFVAALLLLIGAHKISLEAGIE